MNQIKVRLVRSRIGTSPEQRRHLDALGLRRREQVREFRDSSAIRGIIAKVPHLVEIVN